MVFNKKEYNKEYIQRSEVKKRRKEYRQRTEVKAYMKEYNKEYRQRSEVKAKEKERGRRRRQTPQYKTRMKDWNKEYGKKPEVKARKKEEYQKNKEVVLKRSSEYYQNNKDKVIVRQKRVGKEYYQRPETKAKINTRRNQRKKNDLIYYLICRLRLALYRAFENYSKTGKIKLSCEYGIDYKAIIEHLKPFPKDIKNYHIDHIIPLSLFDFNNSEHIKKAFAPKNHQWLLAQENLEKSNRLVMPH